MRTLDDLKPYFTDMKINEYLDRSFIWTILSTLKPRTTQKLIEDVLKNRGIENEESNEDLIRIAPEFYDKLMAIFIQKVR